MRGRERQFYTKFWSENLTGRAHSKDLSIDKRITFECILKKQVGTGFPVSLVNTVMNPWVP
jgi:hypothetical protein